MKDGTLDAPLTAAAEFLYIDPDLLAAAAAGSAQAAADEPTAAQLRTWVVRLPAREKACASIAGWTHTDSTSAR